MDYLLPHVCDLPRDIFFPIDITLDNHESLLDDIDPDLHFYNELHFLNGVNCSHLNEDSFKKICDSNALKHTQIIYLYFVWISGTQELMADYVGCLNIDFHVIIIIETKKRQL